MNYSRKLLFMQFCIFFSLKTHDNAHFWRPPLFLYEPRFEKKKLTTLDLSFFGGNTHKSFDDCGSQVPLFDIWGTQNVHHISQEISYLDSSHFLDTILLTMNTLPYEKNFAQLSISGCFDLFEMFIDFYQNIVKGFFFHFQIPVRVIIIDNIQYHDIGTNENQTELHTQTWNLFLSHFQQILQRFHVSDKPIHITAAGDTLIALGWAQNYEETEFLDFIDTTIEIGGLFPTGTKKKPYLLFDVSSGYDGHWGIYTGLRSAIGLLDWMTFGAFFNALYFFNETKEKSVSLSGNSIIKFNQIDVCEKKGTLWIPGIYFKADHFVDGLSILLGYSYTKKEHDYLYSDNIHFPNTLINNDLSLEGFKFHTIHGIISYDFAKSYRPYGPHIMLFMNFPLRSQQVFDITLGGASLGIDCAWEF